MSVKNWIEATKAIGITAKLGRYGGTYAHKDIAFYFGMWISPKFQVVFGQDIVNSTTKTITQSGVGLGSIIAVVTS